MALACTALVVLVLFWRIDNPRAERLRAGVVDRVVPAFSWALAPVTWVGRLAQDFEGYTRVYEQNQELRRELQRMKAWQEAAIQLEQENARLLDLNNVRLSPELTYVTGVVVTDSGSPFRRSVLLNVGARDGIQDGWAAMDGLGLVGRIAGGRAAHGAGDPADRRGQPDPRHDPAVGPARGAVGRHDGGRPRWTSWRCRRTCARATGW